MKIINKSRVLTVLNKHGPCSTKELGHHLGLVCDFGELHQRDELGTVCRELRKDEKVYITVDRKWTVEE